MRAWLLIIVLFGGLFASCSDAPGQDALIAVATNFAVAASDLESEFERTHDFDITIALGSTGQLYAQIVNGAPYDVLLSADQERPQKLAQGGIGLTETQFTYAQGALILWAPRMPDVSAETLRRGEFRRLAMANADVAPYGRAAQDVLTALDIYGFLGPKIVRGGNIGQTYGLIATGNAELGFVALSALLSQTESTADNSKGAYWTVPKDLYAPIKQDAILLARGKDNPAAKAFLAYLQSPQAKALIEKYGYTNYGQSGS